MKMGLHTKDRHSEERTTLLYLPDGSRYGPSSTALANEDRSKQEIVVTGVFPAGPNNSGVLIETIRDPHDHKKLAFLVWENGSATVLPYIEREGQIFRAPDPTSRSFPLLSLADGILPCEGPAVLLAEISSTVSKFVKLRPEQLLIVACFVLEAGFPIASRPHRTFGLWAPWAAQRRNCSGSYGACVDAD